MEAGVRTEEMTVPMKIAVAYDIQLDGFSKIILKHLRNPEHPSVVWMEEETFVRLATHASREGEFYIPCKQGLLKSADLRSLVNQIEITAG